MSRSLTFLGCLGTALLLCLGSCTKPEENKGSSWDDLFGREDEDNGEYVTSGKSTLELPYLMSDGMVLQQNCDANIWGKATPGAKITVTTSWSSEEFFCKVPDDGVWTVPVKTPAATFTPQTVTIHDSQSGGKRISDVLIGEVWLTAGQSNMEQCMRGFGSIANGNYQPIKDFETELKDADIPGFRYFKDKYQLSDTPQFNTKSSEWTPSSPTNSLEFQAIAYFFGRKLSRDLNVPVGIIGCAYGGSRIEAWMSRASLNKFPASDWKDTADLGKKEGDTDKQIPAQIYNGMVLPAINYTVKGIMWYQGESNRDNSSAYSALLQEMVKSWRALKNDKDAKIPFYIVQLAAFTSSDELGTARMRDAQMDAFDKIPNSGIVNASDCGSKETIHYPDKRTPAERLVLWAESKDYGISTVNPMAPRATDLAVNGEKAVVTLSNARGLKLAEGRTSVSFAKIAGADGVFRDASVSIEGETLVFTSPQVKAPVSVRYCYCSWCEGSVYNADGLPVFPFELKKN